MPQVVAAALGSLALGATAGASLAASAAAFSAATAIGSAIGTVALVAGPSLLIRALSGAGATGGSPLNTPEARGSVRQATPHQRVVYGFTRVGGAAFIIDDTKPPYLYVGLLISADRGGGLAITEFLSTYVGNKLVTFDQNGDVATTDFITSGTPRLRCSFRLGDPDQAIDPLLAAGFPNLDASFRQRGIATATARFHFGANADDHTALWGNVQIPNLLFDVAGAPVYDPRDPTQDRDDPATWKFSRNASLVQTDYLRARYGGRIAATRIRFDEVARSADYDDEPVGLKDGTLQARNTIDGAIMMNQPPSGLLQSMLTANRGFVAQTNGRMWVSSSRPRTPSITITDRHIAGGFEFRSSQPRRDLVNKARVRFVAPDRDYQVVDGPILIDEDYATADGETLEATFPFPFARGHERAQRLAFAAREETRIGRALSLPVNLDVLEQGRLLEAGRIVTVSSTIFPMLNGVYQIEEAPWSDDFSQIHLQLAQYDAGIEGRWNPAAMEQDFELAELDVS